MRTPAPLLLLLAGSATRALSSIVILPGGDPRPYKQAAWRRPASTNEFDFFNGSAENEFIVTATSPPPDPKPQTPVVLLSSFSAPSRTNPRSLTKEEGIYPSGDSFIRGAIQAWGEHLHLIIRPEEVWFTILAQLNFYMNLHAEELRPLFVNSSAGQQEVIYIEDFTWYDVLRRFQFEIQSRVKTPWLLNWIRPNFTTTTENDIMTANVLMMGLTQTYFRFEGGIVCGLPSVTLQGEESDWVLLLDKLDRLSDFGAEPTAYARRLRPILTRFVRSFREPDSREIRDFWNNIAVARTYTLCGSPPVSLSGWITGFWYWRSDGRPFARSSSTDSPVEGQLALDGVGYATVDITKIPVGYARAPFIMRDFNGTDRFEAFVAAGTMGKQIKPGTPPGYAEAMRRAGDRNLTLLEERSQGLHSTLQPLSNWMLYGPLSHNYTRQWWWEEAEVGDVLAGVRGVMVDNYCKAQY